MTDAVPFDAGAARANHILFYELPQDLDLSAVDPLMRPVIARINSSGWVWTAESCQGHPEYDEQSSGWDHNTDPFLRLVTSTTRFGDMLGRLATAMRLPDSETRIQVVCGLKLYMRPRDFGDWRQVNAYIEARNVLGRNRGIEAFTRFADALHAA